VDRGVHSRILSIAAWACATIGRTDPKQEERMSQRTATLERLAPLTGLVFSVLLVICFVISNDSPNTDDSTAKWVSYYSKHDGREIAVSLVAAIAILFFVWFAGTLRARLRAAEGSPGRLSNTAFGGAILFAMSGLLFTGLDFTAADTSGDVPPQVTQTIGVLDNDLFIPLAVGGAALMLATGVLAIRTRALPRWLAWVAVVIGVVSVTPAGFIAFLAIILWIAIVSVLMYVRGGDVGPVERPAGGPPPAGAGPPPPGPAV
jgi:hypothetical protein